MSANLIIALIYGFIILGCVVSWRMSKPYHYDQIRCFLTILSWFGVITMLLVELFIKFGENEENEENEESKQNK